MAEKVKFQELEASNQELFVKHYGDNIKLVRYGDIGYFFTMDFNDGTDNFRNMAVRGDDVWVVTFPRSDWLRFAKISFPGFSFQSRFKHTIFYQRMSQTQDSMDPALLKELTKTKPSFEDVATAPSPRYIKTHLPLSLLPRDILANSKLVYVARDPRDVAVSYYHHNVLFNAYQGDFKDFWNLFINDLVPWAPIFPHIKEAWELRNHPNMLFIFYEDLKKDLPSSIRRMAHFLGKQVTNAQIEKLCEHLDIKNFKKNESVNPSWVAKIAPPNAEGFIRKGKSGGWSEYLDQEMTEQAETWMRKNLEGSDLRFPSFAF